MGQGEKVRSRALSTPRPTRVQPWWEKLSAVWGKTTASGPAPPLFHSGKQYSQGLCRNSNIHEVGNLYLEPWLLPFWTQYLNGEGYLQGSTPTHYPHSLHPTLPQDPQCNLCDVCFLAQKEEALRARQSGTGDRGMGISVNSKPA